MNRSRPKHPKKDVEKALTNAEERGWSVEPKAKTGHIWGYARCPLGKPDGCRVTIWSTPRSATDHAKDIRRAVAKCPHGEE